MKKFLGFLVAIILLLVGGLSIYLTQVNKFKRDGELGLACLDQPVTVKRDEHGIPYIFAESLSDLIKAQGFVLGQDRIFQIELYRLMIQGRLTEAVGAVAKDADIRMQVMGVYANARRHEAYLNESSRQYLQWFADGYNEFVATQEDDFPLELSLLGITPSPLFITDMLAIHHYVGFTHSQNMGDEILSLLLADALGPDKASEFFPLNINPDREQAVMDLWRQTDSLSPVTAMHAAGVSFADPNPISPLAMGSNNWVINADKAAGSKPILCNDPHLDARILPGPWYPIGLFCPEVQAVGGAIPGIPGILVGRTDKVAFGVTNAYGDNQDLYLETPDPANEGHYLEGDTSLAFSTRETQLMIKDDEEAAGFRIENLTIRSSSRGPVISDHKVFGLSPDQPVVLRWTQAEVQSENIGFDRLFLARNAQDVEAALAQVEVVYMNFVFADQEGNIGHRSTGQIPIRKNKQGALPKEGKEGSDWVGFIPKTEMPGQFNPQKGWVGTSNHDVRPDHYPYYYSAHFSPDFRYQRMKEMLSTDEQLDAETLWSFILDVENLHARELSPIFEAALAQDEATAALADQLKAWNHRDEVSALGPPVFHLVHEELIRLLLEEDIPEPLLQKVLNSRYYWLQRMADRIVNGQGKLGAEEGGLESLIVEAGKKAQARLKEVLGTDMNQWTWGKFHQLTFVSPLRRDGMGKESLGNGPHPVAGSGETLNRGQYVMNHGPYESQWFSSLRMVIDLADDEKILGVVSGGNEARQFTGKIDAQVDAWVNNKPLNWWFSKEQIDAHAEHTLTLSPTKAP